LSHGPPTGRTRRNDSYSYINRGWDVHTNLPEVLPSQCKDVDQGCWGLVQDLKSRGLLDETLVIWGGSFGRTIYSQGKLTATDYGRDHHPRCFSLWLAGGGVKGGTVHGETDEFSYNIVKILVHVRTCKQPFCTCSVINHEKFTLQYPCLISRLTGVEPCHSGEGNPGLVAKACATLPRSDICGINCFIPFFVPNPVVPFITSICF
jgi:hypothetical protein